MSNITNQQTKPANMKLLAAQRELYSSAKKVFLWQFVFSVLMPVAIAFFTLYYSEFAVYGAVYGILLLVLEVVLFKRIIDKRKRKAVSTQERLDCSLLSIKTSPLRPTNLATDEEIQNCYDKHAKNNSSIDKLQNWYPEEIDELDDEHVATLICQRANCWWDSKLKSRYRNMLIGVIISVPVLIIVIGIAKDLKLTQIILILNSLLPFFSLLINEYSGHSDADQRLKKLHSYCHGVFDEIVKQTLDMSSLPNKLRSIQDEIYENRASSPLVFDRLYDRFRSIDEKQMKKNAAEQVAAIKSITGKRKS